RRWLTRFLQREPQTEMQPRFIGHLAQQFAIKLYSFSIVAAEDRALRLAALLRCIGGLTRQQKRRCEQHREHANASHAAHDTMAFAQQSESAMAFTSVR